MKNKVYVSGIVALIFSFLITTVMVVAMNPGFFKSMYHKLDTAETMGMQEKDLDDATLVLLEYIRGRRTNIDIEVVVDGEKVQMFNAREKAHMIDVKDLYQKAVLARVVMAVYAAIMALVALGLNHWNSFIQNRDNLRNALLIVGVVIGAVVLYALADFDAFWTQFHQLVFTNDLWLLNPATDRMIQMFPAPFFNAMVRRIIISFMSVIGIIVSVYGYLEWKVRHVTRSSV